MTESAWCGMDGAFGSLYIWSYVYVLWSQWRWHCRVETPLWVFRLAVVEWGLRKSIYKEEDIAYLMCICITFDHSAAALLVYFFAVNKLKKIF